MLVAYRCETYASHSATNRFYMATLTLPEANKLSQDTLVSGIIEEIITVNHFFSVLPFNSIEGNALKITRENTEGPTAFTGIGENIGDDQVNVPGFRRIQWVSTTSTPPRAAVVVNGVATTANFDIAVGDLIETDGEVYINATTAPITVDNDVDTGVPSTLTRKPELDALFSGTNADARARAKDPATFENVSFELTTLFGDAEINGLISATRSNYNDQIGVQVASKAKHAARQYQYQMMQGTGTDNGFKGLNSYIDDFPADFQKNDSYRLVWDSTPDQVFSDLDETLDGVLDKDQNVDYLMMNQQAIRSYKNALRELGGATINETIQLPSGARVPVYCGVPIFANNWSRSPTSTDPVGTPGRLADGETFIYAGTFDDGSESVGISGLTSRDNMGIHVENVGTSHDRDNRIYRVKWYCGFAMYSRRGIYRNKVLLYSP